jgi:hypothetical protein
MTNFGKDYMAFVQPLRIFTRNAVIIDFPLFE